MNTLLGCLEGPLKNFSTDFAEFKDRANAYGNNIRNRGIIGIVAAVALAIIGIVLCSVTGAIGIGFGVTFIIGSLFVLYFGYNNLKMGENIQKMSQNVLDTTWKTLNSWDTCKETFKRELGRDTIWFDWMVEQEAQRILFGN